MTYNGIDQKWAERRHRYTHTQEHTQTIPCLVATRCLKRLISPPCVYVYVGDLILVFRYPPLGIYWFGLYDSISKHSGAELPDNCSCFAVNSAAENFNIYTEQGSEDKN